MANASIKAAFERFWEHVIARTGDMITQANEYTDTKVDTHTSNISNPHSVTKAQVGLGNVDNTSDTDKPISTATQTALDAKMDKSNPTGTGSLSINRLADSTVGNYSVAMGYNNTASGSYSTAIGQSNTASGSYGVAMGYNNTASGSYSTVIGQGNTASGFTAHAEGWYTTASGEYSHAEGRETVSNGSNSHAEGKSSKTGYSTGTSSDFNLTDAGHAAHAEGYYTRAYGVASHSQNMGTLAYGFASHAEGVNTTAQGSYSHAEGYSSYASGDCSHAEGLDTTASGDCSHAEGLATTALAYQHAQGHHNKTSSATAGTSSGTTGTAFVIGCGTSSSAANAFRITYAGKAYAVTTSIGSGADYAEYFEWLDGNPNNEDRRGYFVTLDGKKIKIAEPNDYILGIISGMPCVIGNGDEDWRGRYALDDFGAYIVEEFEYEEEVFDKETKEMKTVTKTGTKYKENPDYDPTMPYVQREDRPEWDAVGMMGVLSVRDDGTCQVNGYCTVAEGGTATASEYGYRVIERVNNNVVKVVFK